MDVRGKKLCKRRTYRLLPRTLARKIDIGIHGKLDAGADIFKRGYFFTCQSHGLAQLDPGFDTAFIRTIAIVVDNTYYPFLADFLVRAIRQDRRIFLRNADLVIKTVRYPAL